MSWSEQVFRYCERGLDTGFLAEPLNALSSLAFLIVASFAAQRMQRNRATASALRRAPGSFGNRSTATLLALMIALAVLIGLGSFLFHLTATHWAQIADVAPITMFMLVYLALALHAFVGLRWPAVALGVAAFACLLYLAARICQLSEATRALGETCLNGSARYVPALLVLVSLGWLLHTRAHPAAPRILAAASVFLVALALRTLDPTLCSKAGIVWARPFGLHFLWHLLNAATLHLLLVAAIDSAQQMADPAPRNSVSATRLPDAPDPSHKGRAADVVEPVDTQDLKS